MLCFVRTPFKAFFRKKDLGIKEESLVFKFYANRFNVFSVYHFTTSFPEKHYWKSILNILDFLV